MSGFRRNSTGILVEYHWNSTWILPENLSKFFGGISVVFQKISGELFVGYLPESCRFLHYLVQQNSSGILQEFQWNSARMPLEFQLDSAGKFVRIFQWNLSSIQVTFVVNSFLKFCQNFTETFAELHCNPISFPTGKYNRLSGIPLEYCWHFTGIPQGIKFFCSRGIWVVLWFHLEMCPFFQRNLSGTSLESGWIFW